MILEIPFAFARLLLPLFLDHDGVIVIEGDGKILRLVMILVAN